MRMLTRAGKSLLMEDCNDCNEAVVLDTDALTPTPRVADWAEVFAAAVTLAAR